MLIKAGQKKNFLSEAAPRSRDDVGHDFLVGVAEMRLAVDVINRSGDVKPFAHCRMSSLKHRRRKGNLACSAKVSCYHASWLLRNTSRELKPHEQRTFQLRRAPARDNHFRFSKRK